VVGAVWSRDDVTDTVDAPPEKKTVDSSIGPPVVRL
jgi:hypothetical protein